MAYHIDVNTIRVRTVILDVFPDIYKHMIENLFPPATVEQMIKTDNNKFLKHISPAEKKVIQTLKCSQYMKVDGALMYKIIRYFKLIQEPTKGWGKVPDANHINQGDDAERMRKLRNDYLHDNSSTVSDEKFHDFFNESIEIADRLDLSIGRLVNGLKKQVTNLKTSVIGDSIVERDKKISAEKKFFRIDSESGGKPTGVKLYYGNDISDQFKCNENEEIGSDEYTLRLLIDGKAECQKIVDYVKKYPEACSSPAIQIKDVEQGSIILHISIDRKSFTSCEIFHNEIQLFIKTIFHHEEIQRTNMSDFDMVLATADYTEQGSNDTGTICSDDSYLTEEMFDPWNNQGVKLYLTIPKKTFAERTDLYLHMDSVIRAVISATTIDILIDKPIQAILMKCNRKEATMSLSGERRCANCSHNIKQNQRFCDSCGKKIDESADKGSMCTGKIDDNPCTNVLFPEMKFCSHCGTKTGKQTPEVQRNPTDITKILQDKLDKEGPMITHEYIKSVLNRHRNNPVRVAVSGRFHTGKSTFINRMRGSKKGDESYAKSGHGNTTIEVTKYPHPENDLIIFYDLPGFGSLLMTREMFLKKVDISEFDYFFIMFDSVLSEDDAWFVNKIKTTLTPFCLVRTKLDLTLSKDDEDVDTVIQNIRQSHHTSLIDNPDLQDVPLFIISSDQPGVGEMRSLIYHMTKNLSVAKCDAIIHFIPMLTESVIQMKYEELCKRIPWAAFEASFISALPVPFLDILLNVFVMKRELQCFIEALYLNSPEANEVPEVHSRWAISNFEQFILTGIKAIINSGTVVAAIATATMSQVDTFVPVLGSAIAAGTTYKYVRYFLQKNLSEMKKDAEIVFKNTLQKDLPRGNV